MSAAQLSVKDLCVNYGPIAALDGVSLSVERGQVVTILGANGVGKSTLLRAISGIVKVGSGKVLVGDREITNQPPHVIARQGIAHVPEGRRIVATLTVEENIRVAFGATRRRPASAWGSVLDEIYSIFPRLAARKGVPAGVLSGGEQQMLAIGRALSVDPDFLLLDEPSMGLAPVVIEQVYDLLQPSGVVTSSRGVLLAEQSASLGLRVASYAYVLAKGKVVLQGSSDQIAADDMVVAYLGGESAAADEVQSGISDDGETPNVPRHTES